MKEIDTFIKHFYEVAPSNNLKEVFTCGCCYWFAVILCTRFPKFCIMYDPIENHFAAGHNGELYDVTGNVTDKYRMIPWDEFDDEIERRRIVAQCIEFIS